MKIWDLTHFLTTVAHYIACNLKNVDWSKNYNFFVDSSRALKMLHEYSDSYDDRFNINNKIWSQIRNFTRQTAQ